MATDIQKAEQLVRDLEARYRRSIEDLRPVDTEVVDRNSPRVLGEIDGVSVIEVGLEFAGRNEYSRLSNLVFLNGTKYWNIGEQAPWRTVTAMRRAVQLNESGYPHVLGIARRVPYDYPEVVGMYVPKEQIIASRRGHRRLILQDYPAIWLTAHQIGSLNVSSDFIYRIYSQDRYEDGGILKPDSPKPLIVEPVSNTYPYVREQGFKWRPQVTDIDICGLPAPVIDYNDFFQDRRNSLLEEIRQALGAEAYRSVVELDEKGSYHDYLFRFNRVLTPQEIATALEGYDRFRGDTAGTYEVILCRLSQDMRSLISPSLTRVLEAREIQELVRADAAYEQHPVYRTKPQNFKSHSLSVF